MRFIKGQTVYVLMEGIIEKAEYVRPYNSKQCVLWINERQMRIKRSDVYDALCPNCQYYHHSQWCSRLSSLGLAPYIKDIKCGCINFKSI